MLSFPRRVAVAGPAGGALGQAVVFPGSARLAIGAAGLVGQHRGQIAVAEPARGLGQPERPLHRGGIVERGQLDRFGHLDPDPGAARGSGLGQPEHRPVTEGQKPFLRTSFRARRTPQRALRLRREMRVGDARAAGGGARMADDLDRSVVADVHDHHLIAVGPHPHRRTHQVCGTEYGPCANATIGMFVGTVRATPNAAVYGWAGSGCSRLRSPASISAGTRRVTRCGRVLTCAQNTPTRRLQLGETGILRQQVRLARHQIRLGDLDRVLATILARRIGRHKRRLGQPVVAGECGSPEIVEGFLKPLAASVGFP